MKPLLSYMLLAVLVFQAGCKTSTNGNALQTSKRTVYLLSEVDFPRVTFILQSGDTLRFSKKDIFDIIDHRLSTETRELGTPVSKELFVVQGSLNAEGNNIVIYQNSNSRNRSINMALDSWIARELLLSGKAAVAPENGKKVRKLKYVQTKDASGFKHGTFLAKGNKVVYQTVIEAREKEQ